jgi:hypothetical protein
MAGETIMTTGCTGAAGVSGSGPSSPGELGALTERGGMLGVTDGVRSELHAPDESVASVFVVVVVVIVVVVLLCGEL